MKNNKLPNSVAIFSCHSKLSIFWANRGYRCKYDWILQIMCSLQHITNLWVLWASTLWS